MFLDKYHPKSFNEFIGNKIKIKNIIDWLQNFKNNLNSSLLISGKHGIGKSTIISLLKTKFNLDIIEYNQSELRDYKNNNLNLFFPRKTNFEEVILGKTNKKIMIFNEIELITIPSEKNFIIKLLKKNHKEKIIPIILLNNNKHCKILNEIKKNLYIVSLLTPSILEIKPLVKKICLEEKINLESKYYKGLIQFCNNDIRKIILTLEDFKDIFKTKLINKINLKEYFENNNQKQEEIGLYHSVSKLLNLPLSFEKIITLYQLEKILLPLTFLENIPLKDITLEKYSNILDSFSTGDLIETSIYTDQNWYLQNLHTFSTCIYPNFLVEKTPENMILENQLIFTNDLNKTSLKNINKKNIEEIKSNINGISYDEIISLAQIITQIIKQNKYELIKDLNISNRLVELLVKINKFEYDSTKMCKKKIESILGYK
ncbi:hypothetical protein crov333 [Cafeteria roenbergensis virus]|uniref:DNA replication factor RFC1 C-terminal domain-containing protein n=1 Tax=Cafeteria roenbergensis virus (strain BV-PW1) TaxID=693272 RepID=E3T5A4_CROVB|nr:hypothetical protein crov333 [Cafeteria roenbergensis virus BV-PW1]ADO67367.1 hypothetical protein crov333 [Cafeteria roenbergensis virus BV-PW1]